ncbi:AsmA family protein [Microvirga terricola]|uniref:AsmA family protein n=1 Tax=Microvirga terricola TaxID=2719797 RepID=A0ABX0V9C2_9HYPH|nr:AsmA family protein [Microvirga terricola]NIX76448.1 AsmA family protein [Microvirga terricola]
MRDILTIIAAIVILILTAAVAAPPFIDWDAHRGVIDRVLSRASGTEAQTRGRIAVRLLPSPKIRVEHLSLAGKTPDSPSLAADLVWAELALAPLLRGEVRVTQTRIGRVDLHVPVSADGGWRLPPEFLSGRAGGREWAIDNLAVAHLLVTTQTPSTGRTDQIYVENVRIAGQKLAGPWRVEGVAAGVPFRVVTGEVTPEKTLQVKLAGGGDIHPRFDIDAKFILDGDEVTPSIAGKAKFLLGPPAQVAAAGIPIPIIIETQFRTEGKNLALDPVSVEAGEGGASLRMTGAGSVQLKDPHVSLKLEGRRLDADSFLLSSNGQDFTTRLQQWTIPPTTFPIDLDLKIDSIGLGQEDLSNAALRLSLLGGKARVDRIEFQAPGDTRVALQGELGSKVQGGIAGKVALASNASDRLARYLNRINIRSPFLRILDGRPFEMSSDVAVVSPVLSFNRMRVKTGDAVLTGNLRYTAPEPEGRGKLEAQVGIQNLNLDQLPRVSSIFETTKNMDVGFILDARGVSAGKDHSNGRISARVLSDGPALLVESLDIVDLAGANARVSGRIAPDGTGRIEGKVTAQRAAPLVDLLGSVWIGGISKLVPSFVRDGSLDLNVVTERIGAVPDLSRTRLRTTVKGSVAGGSFEGHIDGLDGRTENLAVSLATDKTGRWVSRPNAPGLDRPSTIDLRGTRTSSGLFNMTIAGDVGGVKVATSRPFALSADDDVVDSGEAELSTSDLTPFMALLGEGAMGGSSAVPAKARVTLGRERDATLFDISGQVAGNPVQGRLSARSRSDIAGEISVEKLSLPWLVSAFALDTPVTEGTAASPWSTARFGDNMRSLVGGHVLFRAAQLDLGRGVMGTRANFAVETMPDGITIKSLDVMLGTGRLTGSATITRQGSLATVVGDATLRDVPLWSLVGATPIDASLSGPLKFGTAAENVSGLIANLGAAGDWRIANLRVPAADPSAFDRSLKKVLADSDPLREGKAEGILGGELNRAPLMASAVTTSAAIVGGALRLSPFVVENGPSVWQGAVTYDLKNLTFETRGALTAKASPAVWSGAPPSIGLNWRGSFTSPTREVDVSPFRNGLAAIVLKRELEKIEAFEKAAAERQRQLEAERQRAKAAAEEAARLQAQRQNSEEPAPDPASSPFALPPLTPAIELKPPPSVQGRPGG